MPPLKSKEVPYLLAFPDTSQSTDEPKEQISGLKDAPYFQPIDIDVVTLGEETIVIEGYAISVMRQRYDGHVRAEHRLEVMLNFERAEQNLRSEERRVGKECRSR